MGSVGRKIYIVMCELEDLDVRQVCPIVMMSVAGHVGIIFGAGNFIIWLQV